MSLQNFFKVKFQKFKIFFEIKSQIELDEFFVIPFWLLNAIGYDFSSVKDAITRNEKIKIALYYFHYWFGFLNFNIFFFFTELELWHGTTTNLQKRLFGATLLLTYFICSYRIFSFWHNKSKIMDILNKVKKSYPKFDSSAIRICRKFKIVQTTFIGVNSVLSLVTLIPLLRWAVTGDRTYMVPFPDFFFYDYIYQFGLVWSIYDGIFAIVMVASFILMTSTLITTISVEFYSLSDRIGNLQCMTENEVELELPTLIEKHQKIFELVQDFSDIFSETFFYRFIISATIIGLNLFQLRITENVYEISIFFIYTCFELGQVFLQCYFGQFLTDASEKIADEIYNCGWENWQSIRLKKKVIIILNRAQKAAVLTIWKFGVISIGQFTNVN